MVVGPVFEAREAVALIGGDDSERERSAEQEGIAEQLSSKWHHSLQTG